MSRLKSIGVIGIPYNVGWKGEGTDECPSALRKAGLLKELEEVAENVEDLGDVHADLPPRDDSNPKLLNPHQVVAVCRAIAPQVRDACKEGYLPLILGTDDSVLMGIMEGFHQGLAEQVGLVYLDAHGDFNTPETTPSGLIGGMDVAMLAGRGPNELTNIFGHKPQLREDQIAIFGARDLDPPEEEALRRSKVHLYTMDRVRHLGAQQAMEEAVHKLSESCEKIYVHLDIDVLEPSEIRAIHMKVPNGLTTAECAGALRVVRRTGMLCGFAVTVFNAREDPDGTEALKLNRLIVDSLKLDPPTGHTD
jgi:arginase